LLINESEAVGFDRGVRGSGRHGREARRGERAGTSESIASCARRRWGNGSFWIN